MGSCSPCGASNVSRTTSGGSSSSHCLESCDEGIFNYEGMSLREVEHDGERIIGTKTFAECTRSNAHCSEPSSILRDDLLKQQCLRSSAAARHSQPYIGVVGSPQCPLLPASYRARMVGWMREVSVALGLQLSTLFTATSVLDRFVAASKVLPPEKLLQLVTLASMSVAVKYDETSQVSQAMWLSLAVNPEGKRLYTARDLQRCEFTLLQTIDWRLHHPNTYTFLEHFLTCLSPPGNAERVARHAAAAASAAAADGSPAVTAAPVVDRPMDVEDSMPYNPYVFAASPVYNPSGASWVVSPLHVSPQQSTGVACGLSRNVPEEWQRFLGNAVVLAEASLLDEALLSYDYSAVAMACIALAERVTFGGGGGSSSSVCVASSITAASGPNTTGKGTAASLGGDPAVYRVTAAAGLPLHLLAPGLASCMTALEGCYEQLMEAVAATAAATEGADAEERMLSRYAITHESSEAPVRYVALSERLGPGSGATDQVSPPLLCE